MKWFHHECAAKHDPKLQTLGAQHGAEGLGIFWGLLEEIGQHSDTFLLKVSGISAIADRTFEEILQDDAKAPTELARGGGATGSIPRFPLKILAKILFTSPQKLERVIHSAVEIGLFERKPWQDYNVLHSLAFERRADDYTRRVHRRQSALRTVSGLSPDEPGELTREERLVTANVVSDETSKDTEEIKKEQDRPERPMTPAELRAHVLEFRRMIAEHNRCHANAFSWNPTEADLERLFLGGAAAGYGELVLQALKLMLETSERRRIANPAGWIWSCLHGSAEGSGPWIQATRRNGSSATGLHRAGSGP